MGLDHGVGSVERLRVSRRGSAQEDPFGMTISLIRRVVLHEAAYAVTRLLPLLPGHVLPGRRPGSCAPVVVDVGVPHEPVLPCGREQAEHPRYCLGFCAAHPRRSTPLARGADTARPLHRRPGPVGTPPGERLIQCRMVGQPARPASRPRGQGRGVPREPQGTWAGEAPTQSPPKALNDPEGWAGTHRHPPSRS